MNTKFITTLTALLMLVGIGAQAQTDNQTPSSAESTGLEGDLNHDNKVDVADVTYLVNLIMKNQSEAKDGTYYWYIGAENPSVISDIQSDNTVAGWHEIGASLDGFLFDGNTNIIELYTTNTQSYFYIIIPNKLGIYDGLGNDMTTTSDFEEVTCNINGYIAYKSTYQVRIVQGEIIKEGTSNKPINDNFYWYIGVDKPASISDIQTDNTKPGWHEIGASLDGFNLNTSDNPIIISTTDTKYTYYVIIPNELNIYDDDNANGLYMFNDAPCNITGYKAYIWNDEDFGKLRKVQGINIK